MVTRLARVLQYHLIMAKEQVTRRRRSGVLLHVTSLPSKYGIGDFGPDALRWIDGLARAGQGWWQVLPLSPPGTGNSPYQSVSAFAINTDVISPQRLIEEGLLARSDFYRDSFSRDRVEFGKVHDFKEELLDRAWGNFRAAKNSRLRAAFERFQSEHAEWLDDFGLFMALHDANGGKEWARWPRDVARRKPAILREARRDLQNEIDRHCFAQFLAFRQLDALRAYGRQKGVRIIGDLPMFVSHESADVWAHPDQFQLDADLQPKVVAGVPPDFFSKSGQRWGNPLYNWTRMAGDNFRWWVSRVRFALKQADLLRIDHFRGLAACWEIPAHHPDARRGRWAKSPGKQLLTRIKSELSGLPFIAEDLGVITPDVEALRDDFALPGMRVLQFAFGGDAGNPFLPHNYVRNVVAYTGTHDNDTTVGWFRSLSRKEKARVIAYAPDAARDPAWAMIRLAWSSVADLAIAPAQDLLSLGSEARMNVPGSANGNWAWRLREPLDRQIVARLAELTEISGRLAAS